MNDLFMFLMLVSIVSLVVAIVKPSVFQKIFKDKATRGKLSLYFGGAVVLFFVLFGVTASPVQKDKNLISTKQVNQEVVQQKQIEAIQKTQESIITSMSGMYEQYNYIIIGKENEKEKVATFQPFLSRNDSVVLGAIHKVTSQVFGNDILGDVKPTLEELSSGANAIFFDTPSGKYYYLLSKEDTGEVNGFSFWKK